MIKPPLVTIPILGLLALSPMTAGAQNVQRSAEHEIARRQDNVIRAKKDIADGDNAMREKAYDVASVEYKAACDLLPEAPSTHDLRARAVDSFSEASVKLAEQRIVEGRFEDARAAAKIVVDPQYNPTYKPALKLLSQLEDPDYYNQTVGPKFYGSIQDVKKLFVDADGFYQTGRYDLAFKRCEQILNIDPYNIAARKMEDKINNAKDKYAVESYNHTRSQWLYKVQKSWDAPVRKYQGREVVKIDTGITNVRNTEYIQNKLNHIIIPKIEFREATVREAVDFLKQKSRDLDVQEADPSRRGVNIVLKMESTPGLSAAPAAPVAPAAPAVPGLPDANAVPAPAAPLAPSIAPSEARITLSLTNIPLAEALRYITNLAGLKVKIDPYAVTIVPLSEPTDTLITKEYKVPPSFLGSAPEAGAGGSTALSGGARKAGGTVDVTGAGSPGIRTKQTAKDYLESSGVVFPPGASANYIASSSKLIVRNTEANLDLVDSIVESVSAAVPIQVNIEAKFVEINQTNFKELSFDYLFTQGFRPGSRLQSSGGNATPTNAFPLGGALPTGVNQVTTGLRSGSQALSSSAIDSLLQGTTGVQTASPATFAVAGIFANEQFQAVVRALNQKKGVDLLSAPNVTTKSGQRAVIEIIREFRYPTEFQPPQVPSGGNGVSAVTPTTPTGFETRNTGVTLEVEPVVGPDGQTIDLNLVPQVVEFEGFINYGSPIYGISISRSPITEVFNGISDVISGGDITTQQILLTNNVINQPIFSTRKVTTSVSVWDGQTVVLGGLMREDVQKVEDKVPGLGDLPLVGRLFRSTVDQHIKRNLVIFVTARLMNPAGENVHEDEEKEEDVAPLSPPDLIPPSLPQAPLPK